MATVTATVNDGLLGSWSGTLLFEPDRAVKLLSDRIVMGDVKEVAVVAGSLSTTIAQGAYWVRDKAGETIKFRIVVPSGSGTYDIADLVTDGPANLPTVTIGVTTVNGASGAITIPRTVSLWSDLSSISIRVPLDAIYVLEEGREGMVIGVATANLPAWAAASDYVGYAATDLSGTGKWVRPIINSVDLQRCGGNPADGAAGSDNAALAVAEALASAAGVPIHVGPGTWNIQDYTPTHDLELVGDGAASTITGDDDGAGTEDILVLSSHNLAVKSCRLTNARYAVNAVANHLALTTALKRIELSDNIVDAVESLFWSYYPNTTHNETVLLDDIIISGNRATGPGALSTFVKVTSLSCKRVLVTRNTVSNFQNGVRCDHEGQATSHDYVGDVNQFVEVSFNHITDLVSDATVGEAGSCKGIMVDAGGAFIHHNRISNLAVGKSGTGHWQSVGIYGHTANARVEKNVLNSTGDYGFSMKGVDADASYSGTQLNPAHGLLLDGNVVTGNLVEAGLFWTVNSAVCVNNRLDITFSSSSAKGIAWENSTATYTSDGPNCVISNNKIRVNKYYGVHIQDSGGGAFMAKVLGNDIKFTLSTGQFFGVFCYTAVDGSRIEVAHNQVRGGNTGSSLFYKSGSYNLWANIHDNLVLTTRGLTYYNGELQGKIVSNHFGGTGTALYAAGAGTLSDTLVVYGNTGKDSLREGHYPENYVATAAGTPTGTSWLTPRVDANTQVITDASGLTSLSLSATNAVVGTEFTVVNADASNTVTLNNTDGSTLLKTIGTQSAAKFSWDHANTTYRLISYGAL